MAIATSFFWLALNFAAYGRVAYLISEIFSVPAVFNTAYYASKRPIYLDRLKAGEIKLTDWNTAVAELIEDMDAVEAVGAYNSMFDFKKALPFTELYVSKLYSPDFFEWETYQNDRCEAIAHGSKPHSQKEFEPDVFRFHGKTYPLFDLWGLSCEHLLNNPEYKQMCYDNEWRTQAANIIRLTRKKHLPIVSSRKILKKVILHWKTQLLNPCCSP